MLTKDRQDQLKKLAGKTVATVQAGAKRGTGFFIDDTHLLTCWHVVEGGGDLRVARVGEPVVRGATLLRPRPGDPADDEIRTADLALLEVAPPDPSAPQLAVLLDVRPPGPGGRAFVSGFPDDLVDPEIGHETLYYEVGARTHLDDTVFQLPLRAGEQVAPGLSGSPLITVEDGVVVGLVRWSQDTSHPNGGGAIPVATAIRLLDTVNDVAHFPPRSARPWRDALDEATVRRLGRSTDGTYARIDLHLKGTRAQWSVGLDTGATPGSPQTLKLKNLAGPEAGQAIFSWAQWQRIQSSELSVLGGVLGSALFPKRVLAELDKVRARTDHLHVRLLLDPQTDLAQVPWEYATIPGGAVPGLTPHVGTMSDVTFSRVIVTDRDTADDETRRQPRSVASDVQLLAVLLPGCSNLLPIAIDQSMKRTNSFRGKAVQPVLLSEYIGAMKGASYDIVHYIGYGGQKEGQQVLYFIDDVGKGTPEPKSLDTVLQVTMASPPRVLVVQLMTSDTSTRWDPVPLRRMAELIASRTQAVVGTRFPVDPPVIKSFNEAFYKALLAGETVESAVQQARAMLQQNTPGQDETAFGAFAVYTDRPGNVRLLDPAAPPADGDGQSDLSEGPMARDLAQGDVGGATRDSQRAPVDRLDRVQPKGS